jgi:hypothetical protein
MMLSTSIDFFRPNVSFQSLTAAPVGEVVSV